jgi:hypothetical protein
LKKDFLKKTGLTLKLKNKAPNGIKVASKHACFCLTCLT